MPHFAHTFGHATRTHLHFGLHDFVQRHVQGVWSLQAGRAAIAVWLHHHSVERHHDKHWTPVRWGLMLCFALRPQLTACVKLLLHTLLPLLPPQSSMLIVCMAPGRVPCAVLPLPAQAWQLGMLSNAGRRNPDTNRQLSTVHRKPSRMLWCQAGSAAAS